MVCETETAQQIRAGVFDGHFVSTTIAVLLPFPIFLLAGFLVHLAAARWMAPPRATNPPIKET